MSTLSTTSITLRGLFPIGYVIAGATLSMAYYQLIHPHAINPLLYAIPLLAGLSCLWPVFCFMTPKKGAKHPLLISFTHLPALFLIGLLNTHTIQSQAPLDTWHWQFIEELSLAPWEESLTYVKESRDAYYVSYSSMMDYREYTLPKDKTKQVSSTAVLSPTLQIYEGTPDTLLQTFLNQLNGTDYPPIQLKTAEAYVLTQPE